jgi:hypothetical protein
MVGQEKGDFNTGDCLIEVTALAGLTVHVYLNKSCQCRHFGNDTLVM